MKIEGANDSRLLQWIYFHQLYEGDFFDTTCQLWPSIEDDWLYQTFTKSSAQNDFEMNVKQQKNYKRHKHKAKNNHVNHDL